MAVLYYCFRKSPTLQMGMSELLNEVHTMLKGVFLFDLQASTGAVKLEPVRTVTGSAAGVVPISSATTTLASAAVAPVAASSNSPLTTAKAGTTSSVQSEPKVQ